MAASSTTMTAGLAQLRTALQHDDARPGISRLLGMEVVDLDEGSATFALRPTELMTNPMGTVHGGISATLLDSALGCAVHTTLGQGEAYTTLDLQVRYVRSVLPGDDKRLVARASVVHRGRRTATAEARLEDESGRLVAHATTSCIIIESPPAAG